MSPPTCRIGKMGPQGACLVSPCRRRPSDQTTSRTVFLWSPMARELHGLANMPCPSPLVSPSKTTTEKASGLCISLQRRYFR